MKTYSSISFTQNLSINILLKSILNYSNERLFKIILLIIVKLEVINKLQPYEKQIEH